MKNRGFFKVMACVLALVLILGSFSVVSAIAEERPENTYRYYFYMPEEWNNEYSSGAGIYWWEGTDCCSSWPGYKANKADAEGVYYYDVPIDVTTIIWNNGVDGGLDETADIYSAPRQTVNIGTEYYDADESDKYPNGTQSFDNMIYVLDFNLTSVNAYHKGQVCAGEWFYYYGDGMYGTAETKKEATEIYTADNIDLSTVPPQGETATDDEPEIIEPLSLSLSTAPVWDTKGNYLYHRFKAEGEGGVAPYEYRFDFNGDVTGYSTQDEVKVYVEKDGKYALTVDVKDSYDNVQTATIVIDVNVHAAKPEETTPSVPTEYYKVYFENHDNWKEVYFYVWNADTGEAPLGLWPGTMGVNEGNGIWSLEIPDTADGIVFNNGIGKQTYDMVAPGSTNTAVWVSTDEDRCVYEWAEPVATEPDEPVDTSPIKVYFDNSDNLTQVYASVYAGKSGNALVPWPGELCEDEGDGVWSIEIPYDCVSIIFNDNNGYTTYLMENPGTSMIAKKVSENNTVKVYDWFEYSVEETEPTEVSTVVTEPAEASTASTEPVKTPDAALPTEASTAVTEPTEAPTVVTEPDEVPAVTTEALDVTDVPQSPSTETTATADETENPSETTEPIVVDKGILGDVNGDGKVNIKDATAIQKSAAKLIELTEAEQIRADVNADTKVNIKDATAIQKYVAKIETGLPIGKEIA